MLLNPKILLDQAWDIYKKRFKIFLGIMIPPVIFSFLVGSFVAMGTNLLHLNSSLFGLFGIIILILSAILALGGIVIQLWSHTALLYAIKDREENINIKESYRRGWNKITSYLWVSLLSGLIISGGFFLFFVPGLIFLIWFSLASFILIYEGKKGWSALMTSREYIKGNWWSVFWRFLFIGLIFWLFLYLLNILADFSLSSVFEKIYFYIGYVLSAPLVTIYLSLIYENLKTNSADSAVQNSEVKK